MAHTTRHDTMRRALRREVAGTIGLLADEEDFAAMRRYRTFTFDDHATYLQQVEALLKTLASQGRHTTVALFDPEEYAEYCADTGLDPDAPGSRGRFTAALASGGPTVPYEGQPLADLLPELPSPRRSASHLGVRDGGPRPHRPLRDLRRGHRTGRLRPGLGTDHPGPSHIGPRHAAPGVQRALRSRDPPGRPARRDRRGRLRRTRRDRGPGVRHGPRGRHRHPPRRRHGAARTPKAPATASRAGA